jgi:hypothetical protein
MHRKYCLSSGSLQDSLGDSTNQSKLLPFTFRGHKYKGNIQVARLSCKEGHS